MPLATLGCDSGNITRISVPADAASGSPEPPPLTDAAVAPEGGASGSGGAPDSGGTGGSDPGGAGGSGGAASCEQKAQAFADLVAAHSACSVDVDCAVANCGPHGDAYALQRFLPDAIRDAVDDAYLARCGELVTGDRDPLYAARCQDQQCVIGEVIGCCGCPLDAGPDAH